jgi:hypothetical protein
MIDKESDNEPTSLKLDDLELRPYQYKQTLYSNKRLQIYARFILSKEEYSKIGELPRVIKVIRNGIDVVPKEMKLTEMAWSEYADKIKEEIHFSEMEPGNKLPLVSLSNLFSLATEQSILIDELLNMLVSNGVIENETVNKMKAKIDDKTVGEKRREFSRLKTDLDEFDFG